LSIIKPSSSQKRVPLSFRIRKELNEKLEKIVKETGETKSYVIEQLLEHALEAYKKEKASKKSR
jgi:predicted DNA-binding protein